MTIEGRFLLACACHIDNLLSVDVLEAMAAELGAVTLYRHGCYESIIEGGASSVYKSFNSDGVNNSHFALCMQNFFLFVLV